MNVAIELKDLTEDRLAELLMRKLEESGKVLPAPVRERPYAVGEVAEALGLSESQVRSEVRRGLWPLVPLTARILVPAWAVRARQAGKDPRDLKEENLR